MSTQMTPGLFGQRNSSRDYKNPDSWGKNQFNSSFPASLVAYMGSKELPLVYLKTNSSLNVIHDTISSTNLFGINPLSTDAFYNFEAGFSPYEVFYKGDRESIDLVMMDSAKQADLVGLEIKLTAVPDNTTKQRSEKEWSTEIVVRPPTICFLACSICSNYREHDDQTRLKKILLNVPQINHWEEIDEILQNFQNILSSIRAVCKDMLDKQKPLVIQPIWRTQGSIMRLCDQCLDVFVWSDLSLIQLCVAGTDKEPKKLNRFHRTIVWLYKMLFDFVTYGQFDYKRIMRLQSYNIANDKAFAAPGTKTYAFLKSEELLHPRIKKCEIKNIILGGGQNLLSPERRFDAVLVNSPEIFDEVTK